MLRESARGLAAAGLVETTGWPLPSTVMWSQRRSSHKLLGRTTFASAAVSFMTADVDTTKGILRRASTSLSPSGLLKTGSASCTKQTSMGGDLDCKTHSVSSSTVG